MTHTFQLDGYAVFTGDLKVHFPAWFGQHRASGLLVIADAHTRRHCLPHFLAAAGLPSDVPVAEIPAGESFKHIGTCQDIWQQMLDARLDRKALVINLGGGVVGDMGGFCAATWKRGVDFVQVPTTLLSMTDAAIGGKLGIDFQGVKNTVGVFRNPVAVFADPVFLKTLPERERRSGFAEVIKHALIGAPALWSRIREAQTAMPEIDPDLLSASIAVKVRIVQEDPFERGIRALLNYGHTIGHAIESYFLETGKPLTHGEAIAIGMICESQIANDGVLNEVIEVVRRHYEHRPIPEAAFPVLWELMRQDKKNADGKVRMALPGPTPFSMKILEPGAADIENSLLFYNELT